MTDRSTTTECPICLEDLFNEEGVASKDVAEIMCNHLVHSECLAGAGRSLNETGERYGIGGFGPRSGCPICSRPVSMWTSSKDAAYFKCFWTQKIENVLKELGPNQVDDGNGSHRAMPVAAETVRERLREDPSLTESQKGRIKRPKYEPHVIPSGLESSGFVKSIEAAGSIEYNVDQVMYARFLTSRGIWEFDGKHDTLWLWEWGKQHPILSYCNHCGNKPRNLKGCSSCSDSCEAPCYCNKEC